MTRFVDLMPNVLQECQAAIKLVRQLIEESYAIYLESYGDDFKRSNRADVLLLYVVRLFEFCWLETGGPWRRSTLVGQCGIKAAWHIRLRDFETTSDYRGNGEYSANMVPSQLGALPRYFALALLPISTLRYIFREVQEKLVNVDEILDKAFCPLLLNYLVKREAFCEVCTMFFG